MDTESGRVYRPDEFDERKRLAELKQEIDDHQALFADRLAAGKIVPVSDRVAIQQLAGQEAEARRKRRKAEKAARKRNR